MSTQLSLDRLLTAAVSERASDLHLVVGAPPCLGIRGDLARLDTIELSPEDTISLAGSIMPDWAKVAMDRDGTVDFGFRFREKESFRVNITKEDKGWAVVMRMLPAEIPEPEALGLTRAVLDLMLRPSGLVLVTGATGSGKSTTLASLIQWQARKFHRKIVTVEQPIEYRIAHGKSVVVQYEVPNHIISFNKALASMLRQAPNVIMVGELRDIDTIEMCLHAAETGHLVLSTLHTNSAIDSIDRVVNVFPAEKEAEIRTILASCLHGVIAQCLLPRADGKGRAMAFELLVRTTAVANLIRKAQSAQLESAMQTGAREGMQLLEDHLRDLVNEGVVTREEALLKARNRQGLAQRLPSAKS